MQWFISVGQWAIQTKQLRIKLLILNNNSWFLYVFSDNIALN